MPSSESEALRAHFADMARRFGNDPDMDIATQRDIVEELSYRQAEPTGVSYEETTVGGVPALWVRPSGAVDDHIIVYAHGGGMYAFTMETSRKLVGHLAKAAQATAVIPDYRLAPEHPFPAALDDVTAAYLALLDSGVEAARMATAGESAGGNLATAVVVKLKTNGHPQPAGIIGFSPWVDLLGETDGFSREPQTDAFLVKQTTSYMAGLYLGDTANAHDPLANPRYADLSGFPPMYLTAGGLESLEPAIRSFAEQARNQGVDVTLHVANGMQHAFQWMAGRAPEADEDIARAGDWLKSRFAAR